MPSFIKISFTELLKYISENDKVKYSIQRLIYLVPLIVYGLAVIFLLRISQLVLGWHF
jgi:hypothetical protein